MLLNSLSPLPALRTELLKKGRHERSEATQKFFKDSILSHGVVAADVNEMARRYFAACKGMEKEQVFALCESLWQSGYQEEALVACAWSYRVRKQYTPQDFIIFESWIENYVTNWATCDTFCNHTVGALIIMYPEYLLELESWAKSENRWMRRAAAVSLIVPARKGIFFKEILRIADLLLIDKDDMVQKGYGWMLKVASIQYPTAVFNYVMKNKRAMPRTALRYAIEKLADKYRQQAMEK